MKTIRAAIAAAVLCALAGTPATAGETALCQFDGHAELAPGFVGFPFLPESTRYSFRGTLSNCQQQALDCNGASVADDGIAVGNCQGSLTSGDVKIRGGSCNFSYHQSGVCAGSVCAGGHPGSNPHALYAVEFSFESVANALSACLDPTPPPLTEVDFSGVILLAR